MIKKISFYLFIIISCNHLVAQNSASIIEKYIDLYNKKDSLGLNKLLDEDYKGYWEHKVVIKNKEEFFTNFFSVDNALNTFETIKITHTSNDSVVFINTYNSDYIQALAIEPYISEKVFYLKEGKISKTVERIPEEYKAYNASRTKPSPFKVWLRENYCMSPTLFYQNRNDARFLIKIAEAHTDKAPKNELERMINAYKLYNFKKIIKEPNELGLEEFIYKVITLLKEKKYEAYLDLYLTKEECIACYKFYGYGTDYAIQKYKKNVSVPDLEWFTYNSEKRFYDCYMNYTALEHKVPEVTKLSEILRSNRTVESTKEYYFCQATFKIKALGYEYHEDHEIEREITSVLNFGEVIYIPKKGWKLMRQL